MIVLYPVRTRFKQTHFVGSILSGIVFSSAAISVSLTGTQLSMFSEIPSLFFDQANTAFTTRILVLIFAPFHFVVVLFILVNHTIIMYSSHKQSKKFESCKSMSHKNTQIAIIVQGMLLNTSAWFVHFPSAPCTCFAFSVVTVQTGLFSGLLPFSQQM